MSHCRFVLSLFGIVLLTLGLILTGCEPESGPGTVHPVETRVPHFGDADHTIKTDTSSRDGFSTQLASGWATPSLTIGEKTGKGPELFGRISDVIEDGEGRVLALDYENKEVRIFGTDGAHLASFGREGEGPGEFKYPNRLALFEDGTLMVTGRMGRVQFFESSGETYEHMGGFTVEYTPDDACVLNGNIYLHGALAEQPQHTIHVYGRSGTRQESFGLVYDSENKFIRQSLSGGTLACDGATETVAFAFTAAPLVYGYTPDGELQWTSQIQPFEPSPNKQRVSDRGTTGLRYTYQPGTHVLSRLADAPGPGIIAQKMQFPPDDTSRSASPLYAYWLSAGEGTGRFVDKTTAGGTAAGPVTHVTRDRVFSARRAPFPQVDVYDLGEVDWVASAGSGE